MIVVLSFGAAALLSLCFLVYASQVSKLVKTSAVSICFLSGLMTYEHYVTALGAPIQAIPTGDFNYVNHRISGDDLIYVWIVTEDRGDRLYVFPYSRDAARQLEQAKEKKEATGNVPMNGQNSDDVANFTQVNNENLAQKERK